ncbi:MAG TPA: peroxide stress protein YaaA [Bacteroidetes bacterium]|nr:peroxide stress protein YaaA [Bacteroidota bacterium]
MIALLSPAKTINMDVPLPEVPLTCPAFLREADRLMQELRKFSPGELEKVIDISPELSRLTFERYTRWTLPFTPENTRPAILAFSGEVYRGLRAGTFDREELLFAQQHIRILSGLYGLLRPLDMMQAYRLEMGIPLKNERGKDLYAFWGKRLAEKLVEEMESGANRVLINLASQEYFKAVGNWDFPYRIITPEFREARGDDYRVITVYAKKARGMMARFLVRNRITDPEELKHFEEEGYRYYEPFSGNDTLVFVR